MVPDPMDDERLAEIDAAYEPFPEFSDWAGGISVSSAWDEATTRLEDVTREVASETLGGAVEMVMRAAAVDTCAIEGLYDINEGITLTVATQAAALAGEPERGRRECANAVRGPASGVPDGARCGDAGSFSYRSHDPATPRGGVRAARGIRGADLQNGTREVSSQLHASRGCRAPRGRRESRPCHVRADDAVVGSPPRAAGSTSPQPTSHSSGIPYGHCRDVDVTRRLRRIAHRPLGPVGSRHWIRRTWRRLPRRRRRLPQTVAPLGARTTDQRTHTRSPSSALS